MSGPAAAPQIAPDVYEIVIGRVRVHLLTGERLTLIDAGVPGSARRIDAAISRLGRSSAELERVLCTHGHPDHAGGAAEFARRNGIHIAIHPADLTNLPTTPAEALRRPSRGRFFAAMTPLPDRAEPLHHGDVLPVLGGLRVVHTPGHTPGSVCFYAPRDKLLFVGDALQARLGRVGFASRLYSDDWGAARLAVQRMAELDVETIVFSHYPPWRDDANGLLRRLAAEARTSEKRR
jgi:glyoxylase-like metal-dependent hydrolase (beta-lactamase superfamily II)